LRAKFRSGLDNIMTDQSVRSGDPRHFIFMFHLQMSDKSNFHTAIDTTGSLPSKNFIFKRAPVAIVRL
jgi:hypothetical protein